MVAFSVIIPSYNRRYLLRKAVESVKNQTFQDYEIIVVDDTSPDGTSDDFVNAPSNIKLVSLPHSGHPSVARNVGLDHAKGKYIAFLDSDDEWLPTKLEEQFRILEERPDVGVVSSNALVQIKGEAVRLFHPPGVKMPADPNELLVRKNFVITSTAVVRRSILTSTKFSEEPLMRGLEDYDLWLRLARSNRFYYIDAPLAIYLDHPHSLRSDIPKEQYWEGLLSIYGGVYAWKELSWGVRKALDEATFEARFMLGISQTRGKHHLGLVRAWSEPLTKHPVKFARRLAYHMFSGSIVQPRL